ncbi:MAG: hypothetical protein COV34_03635 [Candidatus Zambryskibacteria bacterium CG10_big_fil_rev_8_21_14_0_10_42_12]|uniref:Uncharacterized protein n=1 Tax=Candidatus Zambryskibacteria bacterium CG10_big_fil_rev_8_21_14_0_10_42_12 TaxID=1975115 RepID=A0A2H0QTN4_9BACT|nr:MAG: hypothetical protein COV34_03635 [Candidatus Zambryskibacteria bacterium CG10_big_fil_rev_8_21_14_0_10_42_12]
MYNGDKTNYTNEAPQGNGPRGASPYDTKPTLHEELDKMEAAQRSAQDELSQALHDERTQAYRAGTVPHIEHTARIAVTPEPSDVESGDVRISPFAENMTEEHAGKPAQKELETISPTHSMNTDDMPPLNDQRHTSHTQHKNIQEEKYVPHPKLRTLRTLQSDMARAVGSQHESVTSIALAAHKKREQEEPVTKPKTVEPHKIPVKPVSTLTEAHIRSYRPTQPLPQKSIFAPESHLQPQKPYVPPAPQPVVPKPQPQPAYRPVTQYRPPAPNTGSMRASYISQEEAIPVSQAASIPIFRNIILVIVSITLIGLGGFGLYSVFIVKEVQDKQIPVAQPDAAVRYNSYGDISFTNRAVLVAAIQEGRNALQPTAGSVWFGHVQDVSLQSLLTTLSPRIPDVFARITKNPVSLGYYRHDTEPRFYMTFSVSSFGQAFSGALSWEKVMYEDMQDLFAKEVSGIFYGYLDDIIGNKDVRKLVNTNGEAYIVYGFIDQNTFLLAEDETTFAAVANNIFANRSVR